MPCPPARPATKRRTINRPRITNHQSRNTSHEQKTTPNPFSPNLPEINGLDTARGTRPASRITKHDQRLRPTFRAARPRRSWRGNTHQQRTNNIESQDNMNQQTPRAPKLPLSSCGAAADGSPRSPEHQHSLGPSGGLHPVARISLLRSAAFLCPAGFPPQRGREFGFPGLTPSADIWGTPFGALFGSGVDADGRKVGPADLTTEIRATGWATPRA